MRTALKVFRYQMSDLVRGRALLGYTLFFAVISWSLTSFGGGTARALPSVATLIILIVPLVALLITATTLYNRRDFVKLILSHPVGRRPVFFGLYLGLALPLMGAFLLGLLVPLAASGASSGHLDDVLLLALAGVLLTGVFSAIGLWVALRVDAPTRGMGLVLLVWLSLVVLYDGLVLFAAYRWAAYPMEAPMLALMALNPVDLARILVLMALDASALMGYTGAVFQDFFGGVTGIAVAVGSLGLWTLAPSFLALRTFERKDF